LEKYAYDSNYGGPFEGNHYHWNDFKDIRLRGKDLPCRKSMNTLLHVPEAYTNLLTVWRDEHLRMQHRNLIEIFLEKVINHQTCRIILFFDEQ
jgi:mannobiose 2-epimerase